MPKRRKGSQPHPMRENIDSTASSTEGTSGESENSSFREPLKDGPALAFETHLRNAFEAISSPFWWARFGPVAIGARRAYRVLGRSGSALSAESFRDDVGKHGGDFRDQGVGPDHKSDPDVNRVQAGTHPLYTGSAQISDRELVEFWSLVGRWVSEDDKVQAAQAEQVKAAGGQSRPAEDPDLPLEERVKNVIAAMTKTSVDQLQVDSDGDIGIRAGSAMVFVRTRNNPPLVDVFSPILTDVGPTPELHAKLSALTNRMPIGRLYWNNNTVWGSIPVFGRNFQVNHLMLAVQVMTGLADELDDRLHGEFGGKRFFGQGD